MQVHTWNTAGVATAGPMWSGTPISLQHPLPSPQMTSSSVPLQPTHMTHPQQLHSLHLQHPSAVLTHHVPPPSSSNLPISHLSAIQPNAANQVLCSSQPPPPLPLSQQQQQQQQAPPSLSLSSSQQPQTQPQSQQTLTQLSATAPAPLAVGGLSQQPQHPQHSSVGNSASLDLNTSNAQSLLLNGDPNSPSDLSGASKKKRKRCGECPGCFRKDNCGECGPCRSVRSHQICKMRKCDSLKTKKEKLRELQLLKKQALNASNGKASKGSTGKSSSSSSSSSYAIDSNSSTSTNTHMLTQQPAAQLTSANAFSYNAGNYNTTSTSTTTNTAPTSANNNHNTNTANNGASNSKHKRTSSANSSSSSSSSNPMHMSSNASNVSISTSGNRLVQLTPTSDDLSSLNNSSNSNSTNRHQMMNSRLKTLIQNRQQNGVTKPSPVNYSPNASPGLSYNANYPTVGQLQPVNGNSLSPHYMQTPPPAQAQPVSLRSNQTTVSWNNNGASGAPPLPPSAVNYANGAYGTLPVSSASSVLATGSNVNSVPGQFMYAPPNNAYAQMPKSPSASRQHAQQTQLSQYPPVTTATVLSPAPIKSPHLLSNASSNNNKQVRPPSNPSSSATTTSLNASSKPATPQAHLNTSQNGKLNELNVSQNSSSAMSVTSLNPLQQLGQMAGEANFGTFAGMGNNRVAMPNAGAQVPQQQHSIMNNTVGSGQVVTLQNATPNGQNSYYPGSPATGSYLISQPNGVLTYYAEQKPPNAPIDGGLNEHRTPPTASDSQTCVNKTTYLTDQLNMEQDSQTSNIGTLLMDMNSSSPSTSSSLAVASLATYASIGVDEQFDSSSLGNGSSSLPPVSTFILPNFRDTNYWWEQPDHKTAPPLSYSIPTNSANGVSTNGPSPAYFNGFPTATPVGHPYAEYSQYNPAYHPDNNDYSNLTSLTSTLTN